MDRLARLLEQSSLSEKDLAKYLAEKGWGVEHPSTWRIDMEPEFREIWHQAAPYTMISMERGYAVYQAVEHILNKDLPGDFVECGVWKGGTCMLMALALQKRGISNRHIWLYDTFSGMTEPGPEDKIASTGQAVSERWHEGWWAAGTAQVLSHLKKTSYPMDNFHIVEGDVCQTLKETRPPRISLLRLDTDWYDSTRAELEVLYPRLVAGGLLIVDDYGHFSGSRKAVDEYFTSKAGRPLLQRSDYTGRLAVKTD